MDEHSAIDANARWCGALAGLIPMFAIAVLFVAGGTSATPLQLAGSFAIVAIISTTAGWLAGPLAASEPRRLLVATFGYAIALIAVYAAYSVIQGVGDAISTGGLDPVAILVAVVGRVAYALVATLYLMIPAIIFGAAWSITARGLTNMARSRPHDDRDHRWNRLRVSAPGCASDRRRP